MARQLVSLICVISACIISIGAQDGPCDSNLGANRPEWCLNDNPLKKLLERLLEKELTDDITEERHVNAMEEQRVPETREENVEENVRILELLLDLEGENGIKK